MPYLPEPCETRASDLRKYNSPGSGLLLDDQSEVTDLIPSQTWVWSAGFEESSADTKN